MLYQLDADGFVDADALVRRSLREFLAPPTPARDLQPLGAGGGSAARGRAPTTCRRRARAAQPTDPALVLELRMLRAELPRIVAEAVREALQSQRSTLTPAQRAVMVAVRRMYAPGETFTGASAIDAARFDPEVLPALRQACGADAHRLGILLGQLADLGAVVQDQRLVRLSKEAGVRRWVLEVVESL